MNTEVQAPSGVLNHKIVSEQEWLEARKALLVKEKALTRQQDALARERMELPWVRVEKEYHFNGPDGQETLADLFDGRSQLIVYHFMYGPGWEEGCPGCSFLVDHIDGANLHLPHHDVTLLAVSRAPWEEFQAFKKRMGWNFKWVSSFGSDFNYDFHVSFSEGEIAKGNNIYNFEPRRSQEEGEGPGTSCFFKDADGTVYHTYSSYARGGDIFIGVDNWLDIAPKGRNESEGEGMGWVRHHDRYETP